LLKRLRGSKWGANKKILIRLYKQYIRPVMDYGAVAVARASTTALETLERAERHCLRIALRESVTTKNKTLNEKSNMNPLSDRLQQLREKRISKLLLRNPDFMENINTTKCLMEGNRRQIHKKSI